VTTAWQEARSSSPSDPAKTAQNDAVLALIALGYKQGEAVKTVQQLVKQPEFGGKDLDVNKLVREALRSMN
jgi:Holliday junction DNA helicase RuvA